MDGKEKWYINEIIIKKFCHHSHGVTKWFQIKYTGYAVPEWNWAFNMEDTTALEQ